MSLSITGFLEFFRLLVEEDGILKAEAVVEATEAAGGGCIGGGGG